LMSARRDVDRPDDHLEDEQVVVGLSERASLQCEFEWHHGGPPRPQALEGHRRFIEVRTLPARAMVQFRCRDVGTRTTTSLLSLSFHMTRLGRYLLSRTESVPDHLRPALGLLR